MLLTYLSVEEHSRCLRHEPQHYGVIEVRVPLRVSVQRTTKSKVQGTLGLQKSFQGKHSTSLTLLLAKFSHLDTYCARTVITPDMTLSMKDGTHSGEHNGTTLMRV